MTIVAAAMSAMTINLQKQNSAIQQKLETLEYEQAIMRLLSDNNSCECMFKGITWPSPLTPTSKISLSDIKNGCLTGVHSKLVSAGSPLSTNSNLKVSSIEIQSLQSYGAGKVSGDLVINLDPATMINSLKPIRFKSQGFSIVGSNIDKCLGIAGADQMCTSFGGTWTGAGCDLAPSPSAACTNMGGTWSGTQCTFPTVSNTTCTALGGSWSGTQCNFTTSPTKTCSELGGTWNSGTCKIPTMAGVDTTAECAATYGTGWIWDGSACVPPGGGADCVYSSGIFYAPTTYKHGAVRAESVNYFGSTCAAYQCQNGGWVCAVKGSEPPPAGTCFVKGTKVLMADKSWKNIEDIGYNEKVLGKDGSINKVIGFWRPLLNDRKLYRINNEFTTTGDHLFLSENEQWTAIDPFLYMQRRWNRSVQINLASGTRQRINLGILLPEEILKLDVGIFLKTIYKDSKRISEIKEFSADPELQLFTLKTDNTESFVIQGGYIADGIPQKK